MVEEENGKYLHVKSRRISPESQAVVVVCISIHFATAKAPALSCEFSIVSISTGQLFPSADTGEDEADEEPQCYKEQKKDHNRQNDYEERLHFS